MVYIILYFIVSLGMLAFFINDAANTEANYKETRLHYTPNDWALTIAGSILWLLVIVVSLFYGVLYTLYYKLVDFKKKQIKEKE